MTVYVDLLFALNTVINYLLLRGSAALGGCSAPIGKLLLSAALGGVYAVLTVLPGLAFLQALPFQILCAAVMLPVAFGIKKSTWKQALFFLALSFAFGGAVLLLVQAVEPDCVFLGGRAFYAVSLPAMLLLAGACYAVAAVVLKNCGVHTGGDLVKTTLALDGREVSFKALRDTGNTLRDPITGHAVMIVDRRVLRQMFPEQSLTLRQFEDPPQLMQLFSQRYPNCRFRLISYQSVGVSSGLLLAVRCKAVVGSKKQPMLAAFSPVELGEHYQGLWGGSVT